MKLDELKEHCLKTLKHTEKFPTKTFEEHALVLRLIENQTSVIAELEKIKAEVEEIRMKEPLMSRGYECYGFKDKTPEDIKTEVIELLDNRISELKGDNNE